MCTNNNGNGTATQTAPAAATTSSTVSDGSGHLTTSEVALRANGLLKQRTTANGKENGGSNGETKPGERPVQPFNEFTTPRYIEMVLGACFFFPCLPFLLCQIFGCAVWAILDKTTLNLMAFGTWFNQQLAPTINRWKLVKHPADAFVVGTTFWLAVVLPAYCFYDLYLIVTQNNGQLFWKRAAIYNLIRIGPEYLHFSYVYVLCHKEAHCFGKIFAPPYSHVLQYVYNYYIGLFHGVLPGPFTQSHIYNHHKYDNTIDDVYSTGSFRRDSFKSFLRYVWIWFLYALNVSTIIKFYQENQLTRMNKTIASTLLYFGIMTTFWYLSPGFTIVYMLYPLLEGNVMLAMINYTWHAFIDPNDFDNDYVNSTTMLEGIQFMLGEDYHVVHHQYAGIHWSRHEEMYRKHYQAYVDNKATIFYRANLFEIWTLLTFGQYDALADRFVQLEPDKSKHMPHKEVSQMMKERLQCVTWSYKDFKGV